MHSWMSQATSWTKKIEGKKFQIFLLFIGGILKKIFLKNINTILNAPYPYVLKLKPPAPFSWKFITTYGTIIHAILTQI